MSDGVSYRLFDDAKGNLAGTIESQWGEDVAVTLDDKLHMSEQTAVQTVQGPVNFSKSGSTYTFASLVDMNSGLTVASTATFAALVDMNAGMTVANTATFGSTIITPNSNNLSSLLTAEVTQLGNIAGATITSGQWGYLGAMNQNVHSTASPTFASGTFTNIVTFNTHAYFGGGTTYFVDNTGKAVLDEVKTNILRSLRSGYSNARIEFMDPGSIVHSIYIYPSSSTTNPSFQFASTNNTTANPQLNPDLHEYGQCGKAIRAWYYMYAKEAYDDDGTLGTYDEHDDLKIIRDMKPWKKEGKTQRCPDGIPYVDYNTIPDFLKGKVFKTKKVKQKLLRDDGAEIEVEVDEETDEVVKRKYVRGSNLAMFSIGAIKQLDIREEGHFTQLVEIITSMQAEIDDLKGQIAGE